MDFTGAQLRLLLAAEVTIMVELSKNSHTDAWSFPDETVAFLKDLKANNNREWFAQNKPVFEQAVKHPAEQFCSLMTDELSQLTGLPHTSKIFRIYRDVRFSNDKTPYNTHLHISFSPEHSRGASPSWLFGLDSDRFALGAGMVAFEKPFLEVYRNQAAGPRGKDLTRLLGKLAGDGIRISEPELKRVPAGFDKDHDFADNLRRKGLTVWIDKEDLSVVTRPNIIKSCAASYRRLKPVNDWLLLQSP